MGQTKLIAQKDLAERLGITTRHVRNLVIEGMPKEGEGAAAKHPWPGAREWYNDYLRAQERKKLPEDDLKELRRRKIEADTRLAEIELEKAEGSLIPFEMHETRVAAICDRLRAVLMTIPSKYLSRIQVTRTDLEAQAAGEQIRDETLRALQGVSDDLETEAEEEVA
jgi:phage terminase Nu1 subunit (DNA packaging protein)